MQYDNRYNGALFATRDPATLAGPFQIEDPEAKLRAVCLINGAGEGRHDLAIYAERKDGKGLKKKPVARGWIQRYRSNNEHAPVAKGYVANASKRVQLAIWRITLADGRECYQIKPDRMSDDTPTHVPEL